MRWELIWSLCLLGTVWCQEEEEAVCVCVDPSDCVDGYVKDGLEASRMDRRIGPCDGVKTCCSEGPSSSVPALPGEPRHTLVTDLPSTIERQKVTLPTKSPLPGCGVRRHNGSRGAQPKLPNTMIRIITDNGKPADTFYGEVPWIVRILINENFECGGSLINNRVVLTAAHCIQNASTNDLSLVAGEWNAQDDVEAEPPQTRRVAHVVKHQFNAANGVNDLALLFVDSPFTISSVVDIACYTDSSRDVNVDDCYSAGWGKTKADEPGYSPVLRKVHMPVLNRMKCEEKLKRTNLGEQFKLPAGFLCAGGHSEKDTCKGDGGGPLYCTMRSDPDRFAVMGVISWGVDCGTGNPTVCASVPYYYSWITKHINDFEQINRGNFSFKQKT